MAVFWADEPEAEIWPSAQFGFLLLPELESELAESTLSDPQAETASRLASAIPAKAPVRYSFTFKSLRGVQTQSSGAGYLAGRSER
ncbi:hypothetical protein GCM10009539_15740 [Cryptosporangium japonicum]|uniref:Uncharacterized protein n=1 Tax=Cryptosporangium japonicum TaxID=80872 RepID=A0ABN0TVZ6_9ACTN